MRERERCGQVKGRGEAEGGREREPRMRERSWGETVAR